MPLRTLKTIVFASIALVLSAGHGVCASFSLPTETNLATAHQAHEAPHHQNHGDQAAGKNHHNSDDADPAPCDQGGSDCRHCNTAQFFKTSVKAELSANLAFPIFEKIFLAPAATLRATLAKRNYLSFAHRWRGPPSQTPVSLKIRLQN